MPPGSPRFSVLLISATALSYEILLMRLFSLIQWHHLAYMVISLALLGYGASGTFISLFRERLLQRFELAYLINAALFGISALVCFLLAEHLPFNTLEILWDHKQWLYLFATYCLLSVPFFFAANCICLGFARFPDAIGRIYAFDLVGAGIGAVAIMGVLFALSPLNALKLIAAVGLMSVALGSRELGIAKNNRVSLGVALLMVTIALLPDSWLNLNISQFKGLEQTRLIPGVRVIDERSSPMGTLTVVESPQVPLRHAPGVSLNNRNPIPPQLGVFSDGDSMSVISRFDGEPRSVAYLDYLTSALPYHLGEPESLLVLGMGGGGDLLQARLHAVKSIDAVEVNPDWLTLLRDRFADYSGWAHLRASVRVHLQDARNFVASSDDSYDLIQISMLDGSGASSAGVYSLSETYLYTVEGLTAYLEHLNQGGMLSVSRWIKLPPRDSLKLFGMALDALRALGINEPQQHLILIRGWKTSTLIVGRSPFELRHVEALRRFCTERSFDLVYYPGIRKEETNRYNILREPYFHAGAEALAGDGRAAFERAYKFDLRPATDDRPYFFHFVKWASLKEIAGSFERGGFSLLELGYPVLLVTLAQAVIASLTLILIPLLFLKGSDRITPAGYTPRVGLYFTAIGLAFLFIEIAFIQKFVLYLSHPLYAVAVVLAGFLVFSGLGSQFANRFSGTQRPRPALFATLCIGVIAAAYRWWLPGLFEASLSLAEPMKISLSIAMIAPLAFFMGMPFPLGLNRVSANSPGLLPWAWGINGCASLISAILATLVAIHFGFSTVILCAVLLYLVAGATRV